MGGSNLHWVSCPVCNAGSPAGISTCPRCRYRFRILGVRRTPEFKPGPLPRDVPHEFRAGGQFTLAMASLVIAAFAVVFAWPVLLLPACGALVVLPLRRWGLSFIDICAVLAIIGIVLGLALPAIVSH
jgi:hypothetical protein